MEKQTLSKYLLTGDNEER